MVAGQWIREITTRHLLCAAPTYKYILKHVNMDYSSVRQHTFYQAVYLNMDYNSSMYYKKDKEEFNEVTIG